MSYLGPVRFHVVGDRAKAAKYFGIARKFIADLRAVGGGVMHNRMRRDLEDGTVIEVQIAGNIVSAVINVTGTGVDAESDVLMYVSAPDGVLQVFNLTKKKRSKFYTGLGALVAQQTTPGGAVLYMTHPQGLVARIDMKTVEGFTKSYDVRTPDKNDYQSSSAPVEASVIVDGIATSIHNIRLSPDGKNLLAAFEGSGPKTNDPSFILTEGVGGIFLIDAETLDLRKLFRMTFRPSPFAWAPNSKKFFVGTVKSTDDGDVQVTDDLRDLTKSTSDYVSAFDKDGGLLGSRLLKTWAFTPNSGFNHAVKRLAVSNDSKRLYVSVEGGIFWTDTGSYVYALDATDNALPIVATYALPDNARHDALVVSPSGGRLALLRKMGANPATVMEFDISDGGLELLGSTASTDFNPYNAGPGQNIPEALQKAPVSHIPGDGALRFLYSINNEVRVMRAYNNFAKPPISEYDISEYNTKAPYCLFRKGVKTKVVKK